MSLPARYLAQKLTEPLPPVTEACCARSLTDVATWRLCRRTASCAKPGSNACRQKPVNLGCGKVGDGPSPERLGPVRPTAGLERNQQGQPNRSTAARALCSGRKSSNANPGRE